MNKNVFDDIMTEEAIQAVHDKLYSPTLDRINLEKKVKEIYPELKALVELAHINLTSIKNVSNKQELERIKKEFDTIAVILNMAVQDFKSSYEEIFALYTAEKLDGTFDKKPFQVGIDVSSSASTATWDKITLEKAIKELSSSLTQQQIIKPVFKPITATNI